MKIAIINSKFDSKTNTGAERFVLHLAKELSRGKNQTYILSDTDEVKAGEINVKKIKLSKSKYFRKIFFDYYNPVALKSIESVINKIKPDIIHMNNFYGVGTKTLKKLSERYPMIITAHDYWIICYRATMFKNNMCCHDKNCKCYWPLSIFHNQSIRKDLRNIRIVCPSKFIKNKILNSGTFHKVDWIPNGITIPNKTTNYDKKIIFVGRLNKEKGLQTVAKTLNSTRKYKMFVLGNGTLKEDLESKYKNINFVGFQNPRGYYINSSIVIVPSIWPENFPYTILEAMSHGLCVIGANIGGIPEQIRHMETGLLFEPGNEKDFKEKLDYLINNPKEIKRMGKNAREFVKDNFDWKKIIKQYEDVYKKTIKEFKI